MAVQNDKFLKMLGLATRAGAVRFGGGAVADSIRTGKAFLVILSQDASENTKKRFQNSCSFYEVDYAEVCDRESLGRACGKDVAVIISVTNESFAKKLNEILHD